MSSEGSVSVPSSAGSRIRQFGLYRTIDARTEEFLKLSRKRQVRQGCACAAASTAITITVVVVILLIYEYAIAVEWNLVQIKRRGNGTGDRNNITNDSPYAERLDRSYFGVDQDYYERMPLLVNALQESNYIDPLLEMSRPVSRRRINKTATNKPYLDKGKIKRTSPRPFIFEYRSPTPVPFSKKYGSRSWVDSYRNTERLQNIRQVIKYLETTINAKMGDMHTKPASSHTSIAFSGVYVEPMVEKNGDLLQSSDMQQEGSSKIETYHSNHQSDPLFNYKPNNPGDVNLLADELFRFAPIAPITTEDRVPMFKKIPDYKKHCIGSQCKGQVDVDSKIVDLMQSSTEDSFESVSNKPKSFSVMLNLFPLKAKHNSEHIHKPETTESSIEKIYFTTSKPVRFQFRRKSTNVPVKRNYYRYKKPRYLVQIKNEMESRYTPKPEVTTQEPEVDTTKMLVHVNVYSPEEKTDMRKTEKDPSTTTAHAGTFIPTTDAPYTTIHADTFTPISEAPFEISSGQVEDFHDGSSGVIPVHDRTERTEPAIPTAFPFFDTDTASSDINSYSTNPPEIIKFSPEDAKVPDHYLMMETTTLPTSTEPTRRNSIEEEIETLIVRLKNDMTTTERMEAATEKIDTTTELIEENDMNNNDYDNEDENTTPKTYVPQINGHYRSFSSTIDPAVVKSKPNRKRKLEMSISGFRTYVPMYVEIKRNKTKSLDEND